MKPLRIGIVVLGLFVNGAATAEDQKGNTVWGWILGLFAAGLGEGFLLDAWGEGVGE